MPSWYKTIQNNIYLNFILRGKEINHKMSLESHWIHCVSNFRSNCISYLIFLDLSLTGGPQCVLGSVWINLTSESVSNISQRVCIFFLSFSQSAFTPVKEQRSLWGRAREKGCQENSSTFSQDCSLENLTIPSFKEFWVSKPVERTRN